MINRLSYKTSTARRLYWHTLRYMYIIIYTYIILVSYLSYWYRQTPARLTVVRTCISSRYRYAIKVALPIPRSHLDRLDALLSAPRNANKPLVEVMEVIMEALRLATMAVTMAVMVAAPLIPTVPATNSVTGHIAGMTTGDAWVRNQLLANWKQGRCLWSFFWDTLVGSLDTY